MKHLFVFSLLFLCTACIENVIDSRGREEQNEPQSLYSLIGGTKTPDTQEDSLTMVSRTQSNVDNLMMGRVVRKDSMFGGVDIWGDKILVTA